MKSKELKEQIQNLQEELRKVEHKEKARKGVLKYGEFCLVSFFEYNDEDKLVASESEDVVYFMPWAQDNPVPMQECYLDWYTNYFVDLQNCANSWEQIKVKKISAKEAFEYMEKTK